MREAVDCFDAMRLAVPDAHVMDHGVIAGVRVGLLGDFAHAGDRGHVADHDIGVRELFTSVLGSARVAGVQSHSVAVLGQETAGHKAKSVGRPGDEHSCHRTSSVLCRAVRGRADF